MCMNKDAVRESLIDPFGGDEVGADASNLTLSEQRAEAVRGYLMGQMGLGYDQVTAVGYGETRPVANNETPQGRAKNRRIELVIYPQSLD